jgi:hypothetical protein
MPIMPDVHLRNIDLNLLHALHALLEERLEGYGLNVVEQRQLGEH